MFDLQNIPSQKGRIAIVTGSNTGIGYETALVLAQKDMKVIMACRNLEKANLAKNKILELVPKADVEVMPLDLSQLSAVKVFAGEYLKQYQRLDLLINNAGLMVPPYSKTVDGFESQMGTNYLGHFLLTGLLLDRINQTPGSRIVSLSSNAHKNGKINFADIHWEQEYSAMGAYSQSKIACLIYAYELQRRLEKTGSGTLSVAAHPGVSNTDLGRYIPKWLYYPLLPLASVFMHDPANAALPTLMAALSDEVKGGEYFGPQGFMEMKGAPGKATSVALSHDTDIAGRLWEVSTRLTGFSYL